MKIQKLPEEAILKLQSGLVIIDAVQCVLELVHNSLDAEATGVAVQIDLKNYHIKVIDNGRGIRREDLELVGEKYMTSKYHTHDLNPAFTTYGYKGQALSSILDVCKLLIIDSKSEEHGSTFTKVFENQKPSAITEGNSERRGTGTTVTVEDFMYSMPVRRKRMSEVFDLEEIKNQLQYLAIIHYNVCFTLRNDNKGVILLQTPQALSTLEAISNIFGKTVAKSLKAVNHKEKEFVVGGFISLKPQFQTKIQLLFVNKRIVTKGLTHKFVNNVIREYVGKNLLHSHGQILKSLKNCCHNIFVLEIQCPHSHCELVTNMRKTTVEFRNWKDVLKCIQRAIKRTFKEVLNLDSSTNTQENDNNNETVITKRKFGTSVLLNAVKGDPVKRKLTSTKDQNQVKKKRLNSISNNSSVPQRKKKMKSPSVDCSRQKDITEDSMESPIPKKNYKCEPNTKSKNNTTSSQSFLEFYEWIKGKLETDKNALNLYNDFLQFKNGGHESNHSFVAEFKSPVVGGKLKRKKISSPGKIIKKQNKFDDISNLNEEIATVARQQQNIIPCGRLRMKKTVEFSPKKSNFLEGTSSIFKKPFDLSNLNKFSGQFEYNHTVFSLPWSERQLNSIIKFRNWSEGFFQQEPILNDTEYTFKPQEFTFNSATWASHYQEEIPKNTEFDVQKHDFTDKPSHEKYSTQYNKIAEHFALQNIEADKSLNDYINGKSYQDVEIQVKIIKSKPQRENAMVQTSLTDSIIPVTPVFAARDVINEGILNESAKNAEVEHSLEIDANISEEVPNPEFWNISPQSCNFEPLRDSNDMTKISSAVEKKSTSNEFHCGQKANSKPQNETITSKETQTLAGMWGDSLTEIINAPTASDSNLKSGSALPETISLGEVDCNILKPIEPVFSLTVRHEFIPKGLSPSYFNTQTNKTFSLSPSEKSRLILTVESARNDLLTTVKWQDESTGDYIKPTFPDEIIDEMRIKAGKNAMSFENPVLTASLSYCAVKVQSLLHSFAFTKEILSGVEVLGQLDKKFIVAKMKLSTPKKMELISLFDQHAVDERIKLEELLKDYSSPDGKFSTTYLNPSVECTLNASDIRFISDSEEKLLNFGLNVEALNENTVSFKQIPTILYEKHEKDLKNKKDVSLSDVLKALIISVVEEMRETRGAPSKIPKIIHNILCLEACHKAIKFNRALSIENMNEMIQKLKCCKLPFQCAHGRPSVIPIIDLEDFQFPFNENDEIIQVEKIKKFQHKAKPETAPGNLDTI